MKISKMYRCWIPTVTKRLDCSTVYNLTRFYCYNKCFPQCDCIVKHTTLDATQLMITAENLEEQTKKILYGLKEIRNAVDVRLN